MKYVHVLLLVLCMGSAALAGPNAGGILVAHDADLLLSETDGTISVCGQGVIPPECPAVDARIDGASAADPAVFKVYAAFMPGSSPRLAGLTWGIMYEAVNLTVVSFGHCGLLEIYDDDWPAPGTGCSVAWGSAQTDGMVAVYWFASYTSGSATTFDLGPHPTMGGFFGDDSVPCLLDPIADYGSMGFDMEGRLPCEPPPPIGACCQCGTGLCFLTSPDQCLQPDFWFGEPSCDPNPCPNTPWQACCLSTLECVFVSPFECESLGGVTIGCVPCDPNPCEPPTPVESSSWGRIKAGYR